ncbi:hypothetical protein MNV49_005564 [Pseudohyphozyma bogoriensis]|nr:hypothetical protein MNV49_005564 [Pseudohyphozyma bogoriensis]
MAAIASTSAVPLPSSDAPTLSTTEKVLLSQAVCKHGTASWEAISSALAGNPAISESLSAQGCESAFGELVRAGGFDLGKAALPESRVSRKLARKYYSDRLQELVSELSKTGAEQETLTKDIAAIKAGEWDAKILAAVPETVREKIPLAGEAPSTSAPTAPAAAEAAEEPSSRPGTSSGRSSRSTRKGKGTTPLPDGGEKEGGEGDVEFVSETPEVTMEVELPNVEDVEKGGEKDEEDGKEKEKEAEGEMEVETIIKEEAIADSEPPEEVKSAEPDDDEGEGDEDDGSKKGKSAVKPRKSTRGAKARGETEEVEDGDEEEAQDDEGDEDEEDKEDDTSTTKSKKAAAGKKKTAAASAARRNKRKTSEVPEVVSPLPEKDSRSRKRAKTEELTESEKEGKAQRNQWKRAALQIMDQLVSHPDAHMFQDPVLKSQAPAYGEAVLRPTSIADIKKAIRAEKIHSNEEITRDVALMCGNAVVFNGMGTEIARCAKSTWLKFEELMGFKQSAEFQD